MRQHLTCAITGHRFASLPFGTNEADARCHELKNIIRNELVNLIDRDGVRRFLCGMALGADQITAEILILLKSKYPDLELYAFVPCPEQYLKWNAAQSARYRAILQHTDEIVQISDKYTRGCMQKRNRAMIENADILLAVYCEGATGGTASTLKLAEKKGLEIRIIDPNKTGVAI